MKHTRKKIFLAFSTKTLCCSFPPCCATFFSVAVLFVDQHCRSSRTSATACICHLFIQWLLEHANRPIVPCLQSLSDWHKPVWKWRTDESKVVQGYACAIVHCSNFRMVGADEDGDMPTCMLVIRRLPDQRVLGSEEPCRASRLQNIACKEGHGRNMMDS